MRKDFYVYILARGRNGTLYVGVTSALVQRVWQYKNNLVPGFTSTHHTHDLVWWEQHPTAHSAITREKQIKKWNRMWKIRTIELMNPDWRDLFEEISG